MRKKNSPDRRVVRRARLNVARYKRAPSSDDRDGVAPNAIAVASRAFDRFANDFGRSVDDARDADDDQKIKENKIQPYASSLSRGREREGRTNASMMMMMMMMMMMTMMMTTDDDD